LLARLEYNSIARGECRRGFRPGVDRRPIEGDDTGDDAVRLVDDRAVNRAMVHELAVEFIGEAAKETRMRPIRFSTSKGRDCSTVCRSPGSLAARSHRRAYGNRYEASRSNRPRSRGASPAPVRLEGPVRRPDCPIYFLCTPALDNRDVPRPSRDFPTAKRSAGSSDDQRVRCSGACTGFTSHSRHYPAASSMPSAPLRPHTSVASARERRPTLLCDLQTIRRNELIGWQGWAGLQITRGCKSAPS